MIKTRQPEITIKFSEAPALSEEGKKATIACKSENGLMLSAIVTRKSAAKQLKKAEDYADWVGAIQGKLDRIENDTLYIVEASLQVFEKKPKQPAEEATK